MFRVPLGFAWGAAVVCMGVEVGSAVADGALVAGSSLVAAGPATTAGAVVGAGAEVAAGTGLLVGRGVAVADAPQAKTNAKSSAAEVSSIARGLPGQR